MISVENVPQCPCGETFPYWRSNVTHADGQVGRFELFCNKCNKKLYVKRTEKMYFDIYKEGEYDSAPVEIGIEKTYFTLLGKRHDGTLYTTGTWETKDAALRFRDENHFDLIAVGEFKGIFKLFEHELKRK